MEETSNKFAVVELKHDEGKRMVVRRDWFLKYRKKYSKTVDEFCYWSNDLDDSPDDMICDYSKHFTGEPALFKVFVIKLTDSLEEAEEYLKGRMKSVPNKFRDSGLTDGELKKMDLKRKRSEKKELKTQKEQANTQNIEYLINEVALKVSVPSTSSLISHTQVSGEEYIISRKKKKKHKSPEPSSNGNSERHDMNEDEKNDDQLVEQDIKKKKKKKMKKTLSENEEHIFMTVDDSVITPNPSMFTSNIDDAESRINAEKDEKSTSDSPLLSNQSSPVCELPIASFGFSYNDLIDSIISNADIEFETINPEENNERSVPSTQSISTVATSTSNISNSTVPVHQSQSVDQCESTVTKSSTIVAPTIQVDSHDISGDNVIVLNFDELTSKCNGAIAELTKLRTENDNLRSDLAKSDRRNKLLQDYLVAVDERVPETLFVEKDGGRLYRGDVFITKKQCTILDKAKSDNEYLNNLLLCIFGRGVLSTHTLSGKSSNKTKDTVGSVVSREKLDKNRVDLIYDIMDARAVGNKTKKMTKTEINSVIGKKISNIKSYVGKKL